MSSIPGESSEEPGKRNVPNTSCQEYRQLYACVCTRVCVCIQRWNLFKEISFSLEDDRKKIIVSWKKIEKLKLLCCQELVALE